MNVEGALDALSGPDPTAGVETRVAAPTIHRSAWDDLSARVAHGLLRLRLDVFVVEADWPHAELDDADLAASTEHLWVPDDSGAVAYLRATRAGDGAVLIDRLCTRADVRRLGLASALVTDLSSRRGAGLMRAVAPTHVVPFFVRHGFVRTAPADQGRNRVERAPDAPWR